MKKRLLSAFLVLCLCFALLPVRTAADAGDRLEIISVTPDTAAFGQRTTYTVVVSYTLSSQAEATISLGFNTDGYETENGTKYDNGPENAHRWHHYDSQDISAGSGTVTLSATVTPADWTDQSGAFSAGVFLHRVNQEEGESSLAFDFYDFYTITVPSDNITLAPATKYVPYNGQIIPRNSNSYMSLTDGRLPTGLSLSADGTVTGMATELGVFYFTVTENYGGNPIQHNCTLSVLWQGGVDVEQYNEPGYGFVETATDNGRVQNQYVASTDELTDQSMHCEASFTEFQALYIDAKLLTRGVDYTAEDGSTRITIRDETLAKAGSGTHTIAAEFRVNSKGTSATKYTVQNYTITGIPGIDVTVVVKGDSVVWTDAEPFIDTNGRTMTPFRVIADVLGLTVDWNDSTREAIFTDGVKTIYFPLDSRTARTSDSGTVKMDTSAVSVNGRSYAPVRYLAEYFGYDVDWDGMSRTVTVR